MPGVVEVSSKGWKYPLTPLLQLNRNPSQDAVKKILAPLEGKGWLPQTLRCLAEEKRSDVLFSVLEVSGAYFSCGTFSKLWRAWFIFHMHISLPNLGIGFEDIQSVGLITQQAKPVLLTLQLVRLNSGNSPRFCELQGRSWMPETIPSECRHVARQGWVY